MSEPLDLAAERAANRERRQTLEADWALYPVQGEAACAAVDRLIDECERLRYMLRAQPTPRGEEPAGAGEVWFTPATDYERRAVEIIERGDWGPRVTDGHEKWYDPYLVKSIAAEVELLTRKGGG